jgi:hypothetical protein
MKSFNQFLNESYFSEAEVQGSLFKTPNPKKGVGPNQTYDFRKNVGNRGIASDPIKQGPRSPLPKVSTPPKVSPGQMDIPKPPSKVPGSDVIGSGDARQGKLFTAKGTPQDFRNPKKTPFIGTDLIKQGPRSPLPKVSTPPKVSPGQLDIPKPPSPTGTPPTGGKPPTAPKVPGRFAKIGRLAGPASAAIDTAMSTADERSKGSGWGRSLAKGATVAAGGLLGGAAGAIGGGGLLSAATGTAGALVGGAAAGKAFDTVAGANAKERKGMATANRQRQAGTSVKGIGGSTSFSQKKPGGPAFMSTGVGKQRKTAQLAKTGVVQRGGQSVAGNLAFKKGQAVYKAGPSAKSLAKTSSNPLERVGRSLFAGAYKQSDAANAAKKLATARSSDAARSRKLGVKKLPGK